MPTKLEPRAYDPPNIEDDPMTYAGARRDRWLKEIEDVRSDTGATEAARSWADFMENCGLPALDLALARAIRFRDMRAMQWSHDADTRDMADRAYREQMWRLYDLACSNRLRPTPISDELEGMDDAG